MMQNLALMVVSYRLRIECEQFMTILDIKTKNVEN